MVFFFIFLLLLLFFSLFELMYSFTVWTGLKKAKKKEKRSVTLCTGMIK